MNWFQACWGFCLDKWQITLVAKGFFEVYALNVQQEIFYFYLQENQFYELLKCKVSPYLQSQSQRSVYSMNWVWGLDNPPSVLYWICLIPSFLPLPPPHLHELFFFSVIHDFLIFLLLQTFLLYLISLPCLYHCCSLTSLSRFSHFPSFLSTVFPVVHFPVKHFLLPPATSLPASYRWRAVYGTDGRFPG